MQCFEIGHFNYLHTAMNFLFCFAICWYCRELDEDAALVNGQYSGKLEDDEGQFHGVSLHQRT